MDEGKRCFTHPPWQTDWHHRPADETITPGEVFLDCLVVKYERVYSYETRQSVLTSLFHDWETILPSTDTVTLNSMLETATYDGMPTRHVNRMLARLLSPTMRRCFVDLRKYHPDVQGLLPSSALVFWYALHQAWIPSTRMLASIREILRNKTTLDHRMPGHNGLPING